MVLCFFIPGMSHEEIVATCIYVLDRDDELVGGNILFKRACHANEGGYVAYSTGQDRPDFIEDVLKGTFPLGRVETLKRRMVAFPNSHVHKVTKLSLRPLIDDKKEAVNEEAKRIGKRRIVVFFLVNPKKAITSTREVPPQQIEAGGTMTLDDALKHRLELMKERKYVKQDFNIRAINLCEH